MPRVVLFVVVASQVALGGARPFGPLGRMAVVERDVMVAMRDGVKLATDIARPRDERRHPVVLLRTPYGKNLGPAARLLREGYAFVAQDVRGRFKSEGEFYPFIHDFNDAHDTIAWLLQQPWCDGKVGMIGGSYLGFTQLAAAVTDPPGLKCINPVVPPANFDNGCIFNDGALRQELVQGWLIGQAWRSKRVARREVPRQELMRWIRYRTLQSWCEHLPLRDPGPIALGGSSYARAWRDMMDNWENPGYWADRSAALRPEKIKVPTLIVAGFFDIFAREDINLLVALRSRGGSALAREHSHLIIGPWVHGIGRPAGNLNFPDAARALAGLREKWLARWLKGLPNETDRLPPVRAYLMGRGRWLDLKTWPPPESKPTRFYLSGKSLATTPPRANEPPSVFTYDPQNPVRTLGGNNLMIIKGVHDHRRLAQRPDVLTFISEPLNRDLVVVGRLKAHLFVSTDGPDTDFTAMLLDVRPDGYAANIQDGIVRLRYRRGRGKPQLVEPSEIVEVDIDLWSTAYTFKAGHRLGLYISSSNFPRFDRNLNVAQRPPEWTTPRKATNKVFHDPTHPSYVELPLLNR